MPRLAGKGWERVLGGGVVWGPLRLEELLALRTINRRVAPLSSFTMERERLDPQPVAESF